MPVIDSNHRLSENFKLIRWLINYRNPQSDINDTPNNPMIISFWRWVKSRASLSQSLFPTFGVATPVIDFKVQMQVTEEESSDGRFLNIGWHKNTVQYTIPHVNCDGTVWYDAALLHTVHTMPGNRTQCNSLQQEVIQFKAISLQHIYIVQHCSNM